MEGSGPLSYEQHSPRFQEMVARGERYGSLAKPDGYGRRVSDCGDAIEIFVAVQGGRLRRITFRVEGCAHTVACGNTVSFLMEGRSLTHAWQLSPELVIRYLETLGPDRHHCAELAVGAFCSALADYNRRQREGWKKPYPRRC